MEAREKVVVHEEKSESDRMFSGSPLFSESNQSNIKSLYSAIKKIITIIMQSKPAVVISIALNVKGGNMFVFALLKMLVIIKILMIVKIDQRMVLLRLINKMMTKRKLQ